MPTKIPQEPTAEELVEIADKAFKVYKGNLEEIEGAIGMLFIGRKLGWRPLLLMKSKSTIRLYEQRLGIKIREFFPEEGPLVRKAIAYTALKKLSEKLTGFWKIVNGELPGRSTAVG